MGRCGTPALSVDGTEVGRDGGWPCSSAMAPFEGIDVGIDRRSPVVWSKYQERGCDPWTGTLTSVTYAPGALPPDAPQNLLPMLREMGLKYE